MIRCGLIGCGRIARKHLKTLARTKGIQLAAICDLEGQKMAEVQQTYNAFLQKEHLLKQYTRDEALLADRSLDAVIIATTSGEHSTQTKQALLHDKHVIVEKPLALSLQEAEEIVELARERNLQVLICHQLRYRPIFQYIKRLILEQRFGKLYLGVASIRLNRSEAYYRAASWRGSWLNDGGMLINQGIHLVDLLQWYFGEAHDVYGKITRGSVAKETEDAAAGIITFRSGALGVVEANTITYPENMGFQLAVFGEKGAVALEGSNLDRLTRWSVAGDPLSRKDVMQLMRDQNEHAYMYDDFIGAVQRKKERVLVHPEEGKRSLETVFALYASTMEQRPVLLPLASFSTAIMKERTGWSNDVR